LHEVRESCTLSAVNRKSVLIAGALLLLVLAWLLWPAKPPINLDSRGSNVIAFGDSLTSGYGASPGEDYPSHLSSLLGVPVINAGVSGDTTEGALARVDADVLANDPRIVIVGLGGNDFLRGVGIASTEANLRAIVKEIQRGGAMVVLLGFRFPSLGANYESMYERVAEEEGCLFVADVLDGILIDPALKSDQIHPNGRGYKLIAERVAGPLRR
jgi:lysophospholipase L1-like esterase